MIRPALHDRVRYTFVHEKHGRQIVIEPEGWENNDEQYARHKTNYGLVTKFTNNSAYFKGALTFIDDVLNKYGINAKINVIRDERHPKTNRWTETFNQFLDLLEYSKERGKVKIKANAGGLEEQLKSFESEKFEIERLESVTGKEIEPLESRLLELKGRRIFKSSLLEVDELNAISDGFRMLFGDGNHRTGALAIPTDVSFESDENIHAVLEDAFTTKPDSGADIDGVSSVMTFYTDNDKDKILDIDINVSCKIKDIEINDLDNEFMKVVLVRYGNGIDFDLVERQTLYDVPFSQIDGHVINFDYSTKITLLKGESLSLQWYGGGNFGGLLNNGELKVDFEETVASIKIEEDSFFEPSTTKVILAHELLERIVYIITGEKGLVYSEAFGRKDLGYQQDGQWAYLSFANGFWIRKFDEEALSISLKDIKDFMSACLGMSLGIETVGNKQIVVAEPFKYFFQDFIGVKLPYEIDSPKENIAKEFYYSSLQIGSNKGGEYEEIMGLSEYNTKTSWTTAITVTSNKYIRLSNIRRDSYGQEIPRRKPKLTHPTEDTRYDSDVTVFDAKKGISQVLEQRYWQDDLDEEPQNIFSPETATNLRLTDTRCMLRHSLFLRAGLTKYLDQKVIFASSIGNSTLITKKDGKELIENGSILNIELGKEGFIPMYKKFNHKVSFQVLEQLTGTTNINGREVPNLYGLIEYVENGERKYGRFWSVKPKGKGQFELLKTEI